MENKSHIKRYLIDTHCITRDVLQSEYRNLYVTDDVYEEFTQGDPGRMHQIGKSNIRKITLKKIHFDEMNDILRSNGEKTDFISLFKNEGMADVSTIAYILGERSLESAGALFIDSWIVVTQDVGLTAVAESYGIEVETGI